MAVEPATALTGNATIRPSKTPMTEIKIADSSSGPLVARLRSALRSRLPHQPTPDSTCLLLDLSYSMNDSLGAGTTKISELRKVAAQFTDIRTFVFASSCSEIPKGSAIPDPYGGTAMAVAFLMLKTVGIKHVVMITDGEPDSEIQALKAAENLRIDCFYVGPDPAPDFLRRLCAHTSGQYGKASLADVGELTAAVKERLQISAPGSIAL